MPIFTGTILALSPSNRKTTSMGFAATLLFLSDLVAATSLVEQQLVLLSLSAGELVAGGSAVASLAPFFLSFSFGMRVVTLAIGTVNTLVRKRVEISAVTDIPGLNCSFSWMRIRT